MFQTLRVKSDHVNFADPFFTAKGDVIIQKGMQ